MVMPKHDCRQNIAYYSGGEHQCGNKEWKNVKPIGNCHLLLLLPLLKLQDYIFGSNKPNLFGWSN
jgi:hypothetical protein